jgi:hypothetical protein
MNERMTTLAEIEAALRKDLANIASTEAITLQGERLAAEGAGVMSIERGARGGMVGVTKNGTVISLPGLSEPSGITEAEFREIDVAVAAATKMVEPEGDEIFEAYEVVDMTEVARKFGPTLARGGKNPNFNETIFNALGGNRAGHVPSKGDPDYGKPGMIWFADDGVTRVEWDQSANHNTGAYVKVRR